MFRKKVLDRINAPDSLDQVLVVVTPKAVLTFTSLAVMVLVGLVWSVVAEIPITVDGTGILLKPRSIKTIQAAVGGEVISINVIVGEDVPAGHVLAELAQPELQRKLDQDIANFLSIASFNEKAARLAGSKRDLEFTRIERSLAALDRNIDSIEELRKRTSSQLDELNNVQRSKLLETRKLLSDLKTSQEQQLESIRELVEEGITSDTQRLSLQGTVTDTESRIADLEVRVKQTTLAAIEAEQQDLRLHQEMDQLRSERQQLEIRRQQVEQEYDAELQRQQQTTNELAATIRLTKERIFRQSFIRTPFHGKVLEVSVSAGQLISSGRRMATLQLEAQVPFHRLEIARDAAGGTFSVGLGEQVTEPLPYHASAPAIERALRTLGPLARGARVSTPASDERGVFDIAVYDQDDTQQGGATLRVDDSDLVDELGVPTFAIVRAMSDFVPGEDLKHLAFFPVALGKKVAPGMEIRINPTNIERQRFGSIVGKVRQVSSFPVSTESVVNMVGNTDIARTLLSQGGPILVEATLHKDPDSFSQLKWTSKGPDQQITAGTTTTCRVTVDRRRPITFAMPLLRKWFLGEADEPQTAALIGG